MTKRITDYPLLWELDNNDAPVTPVIAPDVIEAIDERAEERELAGEAEEEPVVADEPPAVAASSESEWLGGAATEGNDDGQVSLFGDEPRWKDIWRGMPEFEQRDLTPNQSISVHFKDDESRLAFAKLVGQTITKQTRSIWHPKAEIATMVDKRFVGRGGATILPAHPIYIVSKGRWDSRLTSKSLHEMKVPHYIVVEAQEYDQYAAAIDSSATLLVLDPSYQEQYDTCDELGSTKGKGPGPARNFVWDHAVASGATWHWVMDDNIDGFYRLFQNLKTPCVTGAIFRAMESFVDRYDNVGMAGPNYFMFASRKTIMPPLVLNTRIYSCNLIRNDVPYRWRARYNEDTDLSIRMLRDGWVTVQFNAFLQMKTTTQVLGGGNTAEFYAHEGTLPKSQMQVKLHPDISKLVEKWGRWHHHVDYSVFKGNRLKPKANVSIADETNDFDMVLERIPKSDGQQ